MDRLSCDRMFVAIIEAGGFAKAAERRGTSAGQASKMLSALEKELGVRLLNRSTRALSPTEVGRAYFDRVRQVLEDIDELDDVIKAKSGSPRGRLRLTVPMSLGSQVVVPSLLLFAKQFPGIELDVNLSDRIVNLVDEGFDAAVRVGSPGSPSMISRRLWQAGVVMVAAPEYLHSVTFPAHPADLAGLSCILDKNFGDPFHWRFRDPSTQQPINVPITGRLGFSGAEACLAAAAQGFGIARVPGFMASEKITDGNLVRILSDFEEAPYPVYLVYPPGRHLAAKLRVLVDFLVAHFAAMRDGSG